MSSSTTTSYPKEIETDWDEVIDRFEDMDLSPELVRGILGYGFPNPATIQKYAIPAILTKRDVLVQISSGLIQKCTSIIPALQSIDKSDPQCQVLIITPTRELAMCTVSCVRQLSEHATMVVDCYALAGGIKVQQLISETSKGHQVIAGTPGRTWDMAQRGALRTEHIRMVVLDEADEILARGFQDQITDLFKLLPPNKQVVFTSSTVNEDVNGLADQLMQNPVRILLNRDRVMLQRVSQFYVDCTKREWKLDTLYDLIEILPVTQSMIFCNTDRTVDWLGLQLRRAGHNVLTINSNMEHAHREVIMKKYRQGIVRHLVATDLPHGRRIKTVRGGVLINFDMPFDKLDYVRRFDGTYYRISVINFVTKEDRDMIEKIEAYFATKIVEAPLNLADII
ncbi:translation initiation factor eIF4A [Mortierella sp. NVP85]|nr:translation initiation factor eIF4A [Mortierella sp. NVP85]